VSTATEPAPQGTLVKIDRKAVVGVPQLRDLFAAQQPELERLYPAPLRTAAARLVRAVVTEVQKNPDLAKCTGFSLLSCAVQAAQLNLEIGGPTGQSYLVPYWNKEVGAREAQFQLGYRGMITLAFRSKRVAAVTAQLVRQGDHFEVTFGTRMGIDHRPGQTRGPATHAYAVVTFHGGAIDFEVMSVPEIDEHRKKYSRQGTGEEGRRAGVWAANFEAMALKTVLRKVLKRSPIGVDLGPDEYAKGEAGAVEQGGSLPAAREAHALPPATPDLEQLAAKKGMRPADVAEWLSHEFGTAYDDLPPLADLPADQRRALAEAMHRMPDAE